MDKQRSPMRTQAPTIAELYWTAGFLEGEGTFRNRPNGIDLSAAQVQKEPLERLQRWFGGALRLQPRRDNPKHHDTWLWELTSTRAIALMMTLFALMSPKRKNAMRAAILAWRAKPLRRHVDFCIHGHARAQFPKVGGYLRSRQCPKCNNLRSQLGRWHIPIARLRTGFVLWS